MSQLTQIAAKIRPASSLKYTDDDFKGRPLGVCDR